MGPGRARCVVVYALPVSSTETTIAHYYGADSQPVEAADSQRACFAHQWLRGFSHNIPEEWLQMLLLAATVSMVARLSEAQQLEASTMIVCV